MKRDANSLSRAERVRRRRAQRTRKAVGKSRLAGKSGARRVPPPPPVPVVMRGGRAAVPTRKKVYSRTRRRYDLALGSTGAELRLPALPTFRLSWRLVSGLMVILLSFALYTLWNSPAYRVSRVQVSGLQYFTEDNVNEVLGLESTAVFTLSPAQMEEDLREAFPSFSSVDVQVRWPNVVQVEVSERQPVVAWKSANQTLWVDAEGLVFRSRGEEADLPVVEAYGVLPASVVDRAGTDDAGRQFIAPELVEAVMTLAAVAPEEAVLVYDPDRGLGWQAPQGWKVYFGHDGADMDQKLLVYQALTARLLQEEIYPAMISIEYLHAPYYRMKE